MKTTQIEVPHFEGYECLGFVQPTEDLFVLHVRSDGLVTLMEGKSEYVRQVCYRKRPSERITLERTGQTRQASPGEWAFDASDRSFKNFPFGSFEKYEIWREV